jgi:hypothetical protein
VTASKDPIQRAVEKLAFFEAELHEFADWMKEKQINDLVVADAEYLHKKAKALYEECCDIQQEKASERP